MDKPLLKQFSALAPADFDQHPVWINCHGQDFDEPWYEETDEETFRPWNGDAPADPSEGMLLARAVIELADGSRFSGFVTPAAEADLGTQQPQIFCAGRRFGFWGGLFGVRPEERQEFYATIGRSPDQFFPRRFSVDPAIATGETTGEILCFYRLDERQIVVER
jgi:hypothetical protein